MTHFARSFWLATIVVVAFLQFGPLWAEEKGAATKYPGPGLERGTLIICGGGDVPREVIDRFVELAGGEKAHIVFIPTAAEKVNLVEVFDDWRSYKYEWTLIHKADGTQVKDDVIVEALKRATGIWFSGGQQQRIADAYLGTVVERELHELLKRGGVIGGTSAGAAIQSRVMIAGGNPVPEMSTGFDFLPGTIIDQHFTERERLPRLQAALKKNPALLGIGIDEDTAIVVRENVAEVMGRNGVHFYDAERMLETLTKGGRMDLKKRKVIQAEAD